MSTQGAEGVATRRRVERRAVHGSSSCWLAGALEPTPRPGLGCFAVGLAFGILVMSTVGAVAAESLTLPRPALDGDVSVEAAIARRRSVRDFAPSPLASSDVGQILWAAQGITGHGLRRAAPSAGALYPLEAYLVAGSVEGLAPGVYRYDPRGHQLTLVRDGDVRAHLAAVALGQSWVARAPAVLVLAAIHERSERKYGVRGRRYVSIEVGHAAQNVYLQATADGLATVIVGAFPDQAVQRALGLPPEHAPMALMPIGEPG